MTRVGQLPMILLLTNKEDITADLVTLELQNRYCDYIRFNTEDFPQKVQINLNNENGFSGYFHFINKDKKINFCDINCIWYRRPTFPNLSKNISKEFRAFCINESIELLNGIWANIDCYWLSNPKSIRKAENKLTQLKIAEEIGFIIPPTLITNQPYELRKFYNKHADIIVKPIKSGLTGSGSVIYTSQVKSNDLEDIEKASLVPSIYQANIKKKYDIRITIVGKKLFPVEIHSQSLKETSIDWRYSQNIKLSHKIHNLPMDIKNKCLQLLKRLNLDFGAIDMVLTPDNQYYFLEINPNGQWGWIEKRTGLKITEAITNLLIKNEKFIKTPQ